MMLCGHEIARGERKRVQIPVPDAQPIEAILFCGAQAGKTLAVTAGVHGCEYVGIEAVRRLSQTLDLAKLHGNVICVPLVNTQGFFQGVKQIVPEDNKNLNRAFPGDANGTLSARMAYAIETWIYPDADFLIDLHSGDCNEALFPLVFYPGAGKQTVNDTAQAAAKALSVPYRVKSTAKNGLYSWAVQKEIPALLVERGANGLWSEQEVTDCMQDILRIMSHLNLQNEAYKTLRQTDITEMVYEEAPADGLWYPEVYAGKKVYQGERLGHLRIDSAETPIEISAAFNGVALYYTTALGVRAGDPLVAYGRT